jgi:hypothetical protein
MQLDRYAERGVRQLQETIEATERRKVAKVGRLYSC